MHCVNENPASVMNSDTALSAMNPGTPMSYPLAMNGYSSMSSMSGMSDMGYMGLLAATKAQAARAANQARAAANQATAAQRHIDAINKQLAHARNPAQQQRLRSQLQTAQRASTAKAQHAQDLKTAADQAAANIVAVAKKGKLQPKGGGKGKAQDPAVKAQIHDLLKQIHDEQAKRKDKNQKTIDDLRAKLAALRKGGPPLTGPGGSSTTSLSLRRRPLRGLFGFLSGLLGLGDDPVTMISPDPTATMAPQGGPIQPMMVGPDGIPTAPSAAGGMNPMMAMMMAQGSGDGSGGMDPAMMAMMGGGSGGMDPTMLMIMEMMQTGKGTPPRNCNPNSTRPACVMYYSSQQEKQSMMMIVMLIMQMNQQNQQMEQQIMQMLQALSQGGMMQQGGGCPPGLMFDPQTGQCVPGSGAGMPMGPYVGMPAGPINEYGQPVGSPYAPQGAPYPQQMAFDPYANAGPPGGALPIPQEYAPPPQMGPVPYAPGGGVPGAYDPNMPAQYAGQPSMTDPYGDVAQLPPGFDTGGGGGGGQDYIPQDISVSQGPMVFMDYSSDVAQLPAGAMDTGGGDGGGMIPQGIDPFADVAAGSPFVMDMQQPQGAVQARMPMDQQMAVAQLPAPSNMIAPAPDAQMTGPLMTQDQGAIFADYSAGSDFAG